MPRKSTTAMCEYCGVAFYPWTGDRDRFCNKTCAGLAKRKGPEQFWAMVDRTTTDPDGCWPWTGAVTTSGYGKVWWDGREQVAHRVAWTLTNGEIPNGLLVCHECEDRYLPGDISYRLCCRTDHCHLGTTQTNTKERSETGRGMQGERHYKTKRSAAEILAVVAESRSGMPNRSIATRHDVHVHVVWDILTGKSWRSVTGIPRR